MFLRLVKHTMFFCQNLEKPLNAKKIPVTTWDLNAWAGLGTFAAMPLSLPVLFSFLLFFLFSFELILLPFSDTRWHMLFECKRVYFLILYMEILYNTRSENGTCRSQERFYSLFDLFENDNARSHFSMSMNGLMLNDSLFLGNMGISHLKYCLWYRRTFCFHSKIAP